MGAGLLALGAGPLVLCSIQNSRPEPPVLIPRDILLDRAALLALPMSGPEWANLVDWSERSDVYALGDNDNDHDIIALAAALRGRRAGRTQSLIKARNYLAVAALGSHVFSDPEVSSLAVGRNVLSYVLAADLIDLESLQPAVDAAFRLWLVEVRERVWLDDGESLRSTQEKRPNNWGLVCGAARVAIDMYLADGHSLADLRQAKRVFHAWLGDTSQWDGFVFGGSAPHDNSWQPSVNPAQYRGILPPGATLGGGLHDADGLMPDDQRRVADLPCCDPGIDVHPSYPTCWGRKTNYVWEALQGAVMQAHLLARCGYEPFQWESQALRRALDWLYDTYGLPPEASESTDGTCNASSTSDDTWVPHITDRYYGTARAVTFGGRPGKNCGFADWWARGI
jgi:hypothetical protein